MTEPQQDRVSGPLTPIVPEWLANLAALGWRVFVIVALVVALWLLASELWTVTASITVAVVIAATFAPIVVRLRGRGRSRAAAAAIVWVVALVVLLLVGVVLGLALIPYIADILREVEASITRLQADLAATNIPPEVVTVLRDLISAVRGGSGDIMSALGAQVASAVTIMVLAVFLIFFFLKDGDKAWVWIFQAASDQKRERITDAGDDALWRVGGYLRGTTILSAIIAITDYVFMLVLGVPLAAPLTLLVFLSGYIPYFGGIVTTALILLVTYASLGVGPVIAMLVLIGIRNVILGYGIRPAIYGRTVSIHPALVLVALPAGFELAGVVGLFAAVPVAAIILAVANATVSILDPGPRPELPALVPGWIDRVAQWSWRLLVAAGLVGLFVGIFVAMPLVVIPALLATILAATLDPLVSALKQRGWSRGKAAAVATGGGFLAVVGILVVAMISLVGQAGDIQTATASGASSADASTGGQLGLLAGAVTSGGADAVRAVAQTASAIGQIAVIVILSTLLAFYFLKDGVDLWAKILGRVRADVAPEVNAAATRAFDVLGGYMIGTGAISFVGAASQFVIMVVLGLPLALPVFVLSFILCFIPYIGGFISTGIAFLITISVGSPTDIAIMAVWTVVFNIVTGNIVTPLVYGRTVHLHPAVVLVAIPAGAAIAGILGMFIVVPALAVVAATWRTVLAVIGTQRNVAAHVAALAAEATPAAPDAVPPEAASPEPA
ncbi:MAG TPA: AI-2E family transporter [Candidatus Limnocylindrales bacterium]